MMTFPVGAKAKALKGSNPNIIVIMPDDIGYGGIASLGNPVVQTPHIDSLKRESLFFTQYHVSARCSPSRAVLMGFKHTDEGFTGELTALIGIEDFRNALGL